LRQRGFIEKLGETLPKTDEIKGALATALRHVEKKAGLLNLANVSFK
jgi:hypothetical protein